MNQAVIYQNTLKMCQLCRSPYHDDHHRVDQINQQRSDPQSLYLLSPEMQHKVKEEYHTRQQKYIHAVVTLKSIFMEQHSFCNQ